MKKKKQKAIVKESKKAAKSNLTQLLTVELTKIVENYGPVSKKATKIIEKTAKQTAKKIVGTIKPIAVEEVAPIAAS